jgi:hypothetical protein
MEESVQDQFYELSYYTLSHPVKSFIHQHIVDAYAAQTANKKSKPISIIFSLSGLYLFLEKNYTGRQVQLAHMAMTKKKKGWPIFNLPEYRGDITVSDVLSTQQGKERDAMIKKWCISVWESYRDSHEKVIDFVRNELDI